MTGCELCGVGPDDECSMDCPSRFRPGPCDPHPLSSAQVSAQGAQGGKEQQMLLTRWKTAVAAVLMALGLVAVTGTPAHAAVAATQPWRGGYGIIAEDTNTCSVGYWMAPKSTGVPSTKLLVTAGHCVDSMGQGGFVYEPNPFNDWVDPVEGVLNGGGYVDAGYLKLSTTSANPATGKIKDFCNGVTCQPSNVGGRDLSIVARVGTNDLSGSFCKTGRTTGTTCGVFAGYRYCSQFFPTDCTTTPGWDRSPFYYIQFSPFSGGGCGGAPGDSGGSVFQLPNPSVPQVRILGVVSRPYVPDFATIPPGSCTLPPQNVNSAGQAVYAWGMLVAPAVRAEESFEAASGLGDLGICGYPGGGTTLSCNL